jgi:hypothetical protein
MRPILPNLLFESISLGMASSVGFAAGTPRLSTVLPANHVHGEKAAIHSPMPYSSADVLGWPQIVIWLPAERLASILPCIIGLEGT